MVQQACLDEEIGVIFEYCGCSSCLWYSLVNFESQKKRNTLPIKNLCYCIPCCEQVVWKTVSTSYHMNAGIEIKMPFLLFFDFPNKKLKWLAKSASWCLLRNLRKPAIKTFSVPRSPTILRGSPLITVMLLWNLYLILKCSAITHVYCTHQYAHIS